MRVKINSRYKHKKIIKIGKSFNHKNLFIKTKQSVYKSLFYRFLSRKKKKNIYKKFYLIKVNSFLKKYKINYNYFVFFLKKINFISSKILYFILMFDNFIFFKFINKCLLF